MALSWNPFNRVIELKQQPASRLLRRTFFEKLADTFYVVAGKRGRGANFSDGNTLEGTIKDMTKNLEIFVNKFSENDEIANEEHLGLLDYATLGLTKMTNHLFTWSFVNLFSDDRLPKILLIPTLLLFLVCNALHYTAAGLITLLLMPFVFVVHKISQSAGGTALKAEAGQIRGVYPESNTYLAISDQLPRKIKASTVESILKKNSKTYSDIILDLQKIEPVKVQIPGSNLIPKYKEVYGKALPILVMSFERFLNNKDTEIQFEIDLTNLSFKDKKAIKAMLQLNAGGLFNNLEKLKEAKLYSEEIAAIFLDLEELGENEPLPVYPEPDLVIDKEEIENRIIESESSSEEEMNLGVADSINSVVRDVERAALRVKKAYRRTMLIYEQPRLLLFPTLLAQRLENIAQEENLDVEARI